VGDSATVGDALLAALRQNHGEGVTLLRSEFVGPAVGEQLREQGGLAMLTALALVMVYIMFRFTGKFAIGAVVALIHDVIITLGAFSLFGWSFDLPSLAAVLAVIGYSLNDTIVVSDRIRENFRRIRKGDAFHIINTSLNQTLGRTLVTSMTTLLVLLALLIFGGQLIEGFAEALIVGVVIGTYSSIYVAANMLLALKIDRQDLLLPEKEGEDQESVV
jgi:preprotein translocase subunit SecF